MYYYVWGRKEYIDFHLIAFSANIHNVEMHFCTVGKKLISRYTEKVQVIFCKDIMYQVVI